MTLRFLRPIRRLGLEFVRDPTGWAIVSAGMLLSLALVLSVSLDIGVLVAIGTALLGRQVLVLSYALDRRIRNSEDQEVLLPTLSRSSRPLLFGSWAIEADFGRLLAEETQRSQPRVIVELGSGLSTIVLAAALRSNGLGRLVSIEHESLFAEQTKARLEAECLSDWATVVVAPLVQQRFNDFYLPWYDRSCFPDFHASIDLLVVDGPPPLAPLVRWPALEVFYPSLSPDACVLLDDGRRRSERRVALRWSKAFPDFEVYWNDTVKGTWRLCRNAHGLEVPSRHRLTKGMLRMLHPRPSGFGRSPVRR